MRARQLIESASFGPTTVKALGQALEKAWDEIAGEFAGKPDEVIAARERLAIALLSVAWEDSRDVDALKEGALHVFRSDRAGGSSPPTGAANTPCREQS
jgi:hypothetical protein